MRLLENEAAYEKLKFYQDICDIRRKVYLISEPFRKTHLKVVSQMRDAARSAKQNIREGYKKGSAAEFARGIVISLGSLEELSADIEDFYEDGLIEKKDFLILSGLFKSADYMANRYLVSLRKMERDKKWKNPYAGYKKLKEATQG